jgi:hypothetical protein
MIIKNTTNKTKAKINTPSPLIGLLTLKSAKKNKRLNEKQILPPRDKLRNRLIIITEARKTRIKRFGRLAAARE